MALPPVKQRQPPDKQHSSHQSANDPFLQIDSTNSSNNSSNLRHEEAIHVTISKEELDWARRVMKMANSGLLVIKL